MNAYELKRLVELLKENGIDLAEELAAHLVKAVFSWLKESAELSENKFDDFAVVIYPLIEKEILKLVDKIDGEEG